MAQAEACASPEICWTRLEKTTSLVQASAWTGIDPNPIIDQGVKPIIDIGRSVESKMVNSTLELF
jgi:hypothetical protein